MNGVLLSDKSNQYRRALLTYIFEAGAGHTGGSLSCVDIVNVLYNEAMDITPLNWPTLDRDFYVHSKGHSVETLYVVLADLGFFDPKRLETGNRYRTDFVGHPTRKVPGVEHNTGGLGHGLSFSVGLALAAKLDGRTSRVFCLLGDGELEEGSNWEAAMTGSHYQLDNLIAIVDRNRLQITGDTQDVVSLEPLAAKWTSFGWEVHESDGHNVGGLASELLSVPFMSRKPSLLIANTTKGKGVSFIEDQATWHHRLPTQEELTAAIAELEAANTETQEGYE